MPSPVVLINVFEVPVGMEREFIEWWKQSSETLRMEPGFLDARLHRSLKTNARFQFINVAHWKTEESLDLARLKNKEILQARSPGKGNPALYEMVAEY